MKYFPEPIEDAIETRQKIADIYLAQGERINYMAELERIVDTDASGGEGRTDRTQYLAAKASLVLAEPKLEAYKKVKLVKPFQQNLKKKKQTMSIAIDAYTKMIDYQVGDVTAAATYYLAEIYYEFSVSLIESERPTNLNDEELEEYELVIEDQAFPFEDKSISVHEKNLELLDLGVYNEWIDKSIAKLAALLPARYAKTERDSAFVELIQPLPIVPVDMQKQTAEKTVTSEDASKLELSPQESDKEPAPEEVIPAESDQEEPVQQDVTPEQTKSGEPDQIKEEQEETDKEVTPEQEQTDE